MGAYFRTVWDCRYFWLSLVKMDLRARYRGSVLGVGWSMLNPILMTIILCVVFSTIFQQDIRFYAPFLLAGLTCWNYVIAVSLQGCTCFFTAETYIRQHPAPLAIYSLRTMLGAGFHFGLGLILVLVLSALLRGVTGPKAMLSLLPTLLLLLLLGWSLATVFGLATVRFRDTQHLSEICFQLLFYLTPVIYPPELLQNRGLGWMISCNPLVPFLELLRGPLLDGQVPSLSTYAASATIALVAAGMALIALHVEERKVIFHL